MNKAVSDKVIGRLGQYRRLLGRLVEEGARFVFSHELASLARVTAAQVRRDLMVLGASGNPAKGYAVSDLLGDIERFLDAPDGQNVVLVGVGNLGRALLAYFAGHSPKLRMIAAFDNNPEKTGRVIQGCRCYGIDELPEVVRKEEATVGVIAVPADSAQAVADRLIDSGIYGLLNYAPVRIHVPANVYVEDIDMTVSMERVAYMARQNAVSTEKL